MEEKTSSLEVGARSSAPSMTSTISSRQAVEISELYPTEVPSLRWAILAAPSMRTTVLLKENFSEGSVFATAFQIPPVPSRAGKRKVALGPLDADGSGRELEGGEQGHSPVSGGLLVEHVAHDKLEGGSSDTLSEPLALHL